MPSDELNRLMLEQIAHSIEQAWRETAAIEKDLKMEDEQISIKVPLASVLKKENAAK